MTTPRELPRSWPTIGLSSCVGIYVGPASSFRTLVRRPRARVSLFLKTFEDFAPVCKGDALAYARPKDLRVVFEVRQPCKGTARIWNAVTRKYTYHDREEPRLVLWGAGSSAPTPQAVADYLALKRGEVGSMHIDLRNHQRFNELSELLSSQQVRSLETLIWIEPESATG